MFSSWSRTRKSTPPPAAGDSATSRTANLATRRCTKPATPATCPQKIATSSSPVTRLGPERHRKTSSEDGDGGDDIQQATHCAPADRSLQRLHLGGRYDLDALSGAGRGERLWTSHAAGPPRRAQGRASRLLRAASSIPSGRLRDLEIRCTDSEGGVEEQELRTRQLGWRHPCRVRTSARRDRRRRALVFQRLRPYRSRLG